MNDNQSLQTPKLVGAIVMTAIVLIGVYFLILNNKTESTTSAATSSLTSNSDIGSDSTDEDSDDSNDELNDDSTNSTSTSSGSVSSNTGSSTSTGGYKDGTYTATANYNVPKSSNTIEVTITVKDSAITTVTTRHSYSDHESGRYVTSFSNDISGAVVGKKLNAAQVGRVSGASDTSEGFNRALDIIITQAKA